MPINLQGSGNIAEGWGAPPKLDAPSIGGLVSAILGNRLGQQELAQKSTAEAIKQMNEQRDSAAFLRAAQQAGIIPQGDYSGMDAKSIAALASGIAAQTPDRQRDALLQAQAAYYNRSPGAGMGGGRGSNKIWIPELNGYGTPDQAFQVRSRQAGLLGKQAGEIASEQADYGFGDNVPSGDKSYGYMQNPDKKTLRYAMTDEERKNPDFMSPVDILSGAGKEQSQKGLIDKDTGQPLAPIFTPGVYTQRQEASALRQKILEQKKGLEEKMMNPPAAAADTGGGGGGGGPHDDAITKANQIKEDLKLGRIDPDEARAQIKALNIPGLQ